MAYEIYFTPEAREDLLALRAYERKKVLDAIEVHLRYDPEKTSRSRIKRLQGMASPQYRLRVDDIRAFYDVWHSTEEQSVEILAIREKSAAMRWLEEFGRREI